MEPVPTFVNLKWNQKRQKFKNMRWLRRIFKLEHDFHWLLGLMGKVGTFRGVKRHFSDCLP